MSRGAEFFSCIDPRAHILVLDLGFLGDTILLIPALATIRRALPQAKLEVMVSSHITKILEVCPWLDGVQGYPRFPKGPKWYEDFGRVGALRAQKYDVVINLNGSDRSSVLSRLSGATLRLGRVPPKVPLFWKWCFTDIVDVPRDRPVYLQHLAVLTAAGFPGRMGEPMFPIEIPAAVKKRVGERLGENRPYIHVSPFATMDEKELPEEVLAGVLNAAHASRPDLAFVLSVAPNEREKGKLASLLKRLNFTPWRLFPGDLDLVELTAVIRGALVHLGGDSGALHVAFMAGAPTLSWWRDYPGRIAWQPAGSEHFSVTLQKDATVENLLSLLEKALKAQSP